MPQRSIQIPSELITHTSGAPFALVDERGQPLDPSAIRDGRAFVAETATPQLDHWLADNLAAIVTSRELGPIPQAWASFRVLATLARPLYVDLSSFRETSALMEALAAVGQLARRSHEVLGQTISVFPPDHTPLTHAVETAILASGLAAAMDRKEPSFLAGIALAGMFADVGKLRLAPSLYTGYQRLTKMHREQMELHPTYSVEVMHSLGLRSVEATPAILGHHERVDGSGYPDRLTGFEVLPAAQFVGLADVYSTATAATVDHAAASPAAVPEQLVGTFDSELLRVFVSSLAAPAAGSRPAVA